MSITVQKTVAPHESYIEINGGAEYQAIWSGWIAAPGRPVFQKVWQTFWGALSNTGLNPDLFEAPNNLVSGSYEGTKSLSLDNKRIYDLYEASAPGGLLSDQVDLAWGLAMIEANNAIDALRGAVGNFSDADSIDNEEKLKAWPAPTMAIRPKSPGQLEIIKQGAVYATKETITTVAAAATHVAAATGKAVGGAATAAAQGVIGGAVAQAKSQGLAGVATIFLGWLLIKTFFLKK